MRIDDGGFIIERIIEVSCIVCKITSSIMRLLRNKRFRGEFSKIRFILNAESKKIISIKGD